MAIGWAANNTGGAPTGPAGGDLDGTYPDPTVDGLQGEPVSADVPVLGDVLAFDGTEWTPTTVTAATVGADPTGTAAAAIVTHVGLADPHAQYVLESAGTLTGGTLAGTTTVTDTFSASGATAVSVPTVAFPDSDTSAASTAFVSVNFAPLASPALTGSPTTTTPPAGDNDTSIATTAFVQGEITSANAVSRQLQFSSYFDDFIGSTATTGDLTWHGTNSGAASSLSANGTALATVEGYRFLDSGTNAAGFSRISKAEVVVGQGSFFSPWTEGNIDLIWRLRMPLLPIAGSDPSVVVGFGNGSLSTGTVGLAGIMAYQNSLNANWILASRNANADVVAPVTATFGLTANVWQTVVMRITSVSATLYAGASYAAAIAAGARATITMAGATTTAVSQYTKLVNTATVAVERAIELDFCGFEFSRTSGR